MKKNLYYKVRTGIAVAFAAVVLINSSVSIMAAARGSSSNVITLKKGTVSITGKTTKSISGVDAKVCASRGPSYNDHISVWVTDENQVRVSDGISLTYASSTVYHNIPYLDYKGVVGDSYCLAASLSQSALSNQVTFDYHFIP